MILRSFIFKRYSFSVAVRTLRKTQSVFENQTVNRCKTSKNFLFNHGVTTTTGVSLCLLGITKALCNNTEEIVAPDPNTLTTETLLKNSTFNVVESTTSFLSLVTVSLTESCEQYTKALYILIKLMEYRLEVLGNEENEKKISDLIIETRASVNKFKVKNQELQSMYMSAYNLVNEASTAAYTAGSEFHSTVATSLLQSSEIHLSKCRKDLKEAEGQLREMTAKVINAEAKHAENHRQKHKNGNEEKEDLPDTQVKNGEVEKLDLFNIQDKDDEQILDSDANEKDDKFY